MRKQVLLITKARKSGWLQDASDSTATQLQAFAEQVSLSADVELHVTSLDQLDFSISENEVSVFDHSTKKDISEFDVVHMRGVHEEMAYYADFAKAIALYAEHHNKVWIEPESVGASFGKLAQAMLFALHEVKTPRTRSCWWGSRLAGLCLENRDEFPLIVKASFGTQGHNNYLIESVEELQNVLQAANEPFVAQNLIPNNGDYRVLLLGDAEPLVFWRPRIKGSHLSNTSQGSVPEKRAAIDEEALALARKVQLLTNRVCVGVDLMQDNQTGQWYVLEANVHAALATGALIEDKAYYYAQMIQRLLEGKV